jgi:hypothetical protein
MMARKKHGTTSHWSVRRAGPFLLLHWCLPLSRQSVGVVIVMVEF